MMPHQGATAPTEPPVASSPLAASAATVAVTELPSQPVTPEFIRSLTAALMVAEHASERMITLAGDLPAPGPEVVVATRLVRQHPHIQRDALAALEHVDAALDEAREALPEIRRAFGEARGTAVARASELELALDDLEDRMAVVAALAPRLVEAVARITEASVTIERADAVSRVSDAVNAARRCVAEAFRLAGRGEDVIAVVEARCARRLTVTRISLPHEAALRAFAESTERAALTSRGAE